MGGLVGLGCLEWHQRGVGLYRAGGDGSDLLCFLHMPDMGLAVDLPKGEGNVR